MNDDSEKPGNEHSVIDPYRSMEPNGVLTEAATRWVHDGPVHQTPPVGPSPMTRDEPLFHVAADEPAQNLSPEPIPGEFAARQDDAHEGEVPRTEIDVSAEQTRVAHALANAERLQREADDNALFFG